MNMNRRQFFKVCSAGLGGSSIALMGFSPTAALAEVRTFKLARATETRNICPYCSVSCGVLIYSTGDKSKNAQGRDHPHRRRPGQSGQSRHAVPQGRRPAATWSRARTASSSRKCAKPAATNGSASPGMRRSTRIAKHMKADRDANFIAKNKDGVTVNRWNTSGFLASRRASNESGYLTVKRSAQPGHDRRIRHPGTYLTRSHGGQSGSEFRAWCDDQPLGGHQERRSGFRHGRQSRRSAPLRLQVGDRGQEDAQGQAGRRRPALQPHGVGGRFLCADCVRVPTSPSSAASSITCLSNDKIHHDYVKAYTNASFLIDARLRVRRRHLLRLQRREAQLRQGHLEIPARRGRLRQGRRDPAGPELRLPAA